MSDELVCAEKVAFDSKQLANAAKILAEAKYGISLKVYLCRHCGLWHFSTA